MKFKKLGFSAPLSFGRLTNKPAVNSKHSLKFDLNIMLAIFFFGGGWGGGRSGGHVV